MKTKKTVEPDAILLRKLRTRALSISEARTALRAADTAGEDAETIIEEFLRLGYLDDAALAEQLVRAGVERKGQGRRAIALALAKRGIPREVADAAIAALPDDDADRALEYARSKAPQLDRFDHDVALRRLVGQLARRGYGGAAASSAAKRALAESREAPSSGVRFR